MAALFNFSRLAGGGAITAPRRVLRWRYWPGVLVLASLAVGPWLVLIAALFAGLALLHACGAV